MFVYSSQCQQGELESTLQLKLGICFRLDCKVFAYCFSSTIILVASSPYLSHHLYALVFISFPFSLIFCLTLPTLLFFSPLSVLSTSSALRSCSTGDSLLSSASIRSAKSAPALAPPLPVLLHHHHHPLLPPLVDQLAGTRSLYYLPAFL